MTVPRLMLVSKSARFFHLFPGLLMMSVELQKNKKIRGTRSYATKVQKDIQDLLKAFDPTKLNKLKVLNCLF